MRLLSTVVGLLIAGISLSATPSQDVRTVEIAIRHSKFSVSEIDAKVGETVRFVVRNADPIAHELIVGPMPVQLRHESGREAWHPPVPGEVSVRLFDSASTSYTFDEPGTVWFGCHLPGHWDYGMQGRINVG